METEKKSIFAGHKEYLEKSFLEELNYKIWSTKGARFEADKRLTTISKVSNISMAILSAYLIIAGLFSVYISNTNINSQLISYIITALSIILLVLSQFENNQNYKLRANNYHNCGLELSILYNKLRIFKTLKKNPSDEDIETFANTLAKEYQDILAKYENHHPLDYANFKLGHPEYFKNLNSLDRFFITANNYRILYGWYSLIISLPPILIVILCVIS